jgi:hypothetical protein
MFARNGVLNNLQIRLVRAANDDFPGGIQRELMALQRAGNTLEDHVWHGTSNHCSLRAVSGEVRQG